MPKLVKTALEQSLDTPLTDVVQKMTTDLTISTNPVFICGVNRKINIGNFENIDVYAGITIPLPNVSPDDMEGLQDAVEKAAEYAFGLMSKETGERYLLIKESQQGN